MFANADLYNEQYVFESLKGNGLEELVVQELVGLDGLLCMFLIH